MNKFEHEIIGDIYGNVLYIGPPKESIEEALGETYKEVLANKSTLHAYFFRIEERSEKFSEKLIIETHEYCRAMNKYSGGKLNSIELHLNKEELINILKNSV